MKRKVLPAPGKPSVPKWKIRRAAQKAKAEPRAACACQRVKYDPIHNGDGTLSERWRCGDCGTMFVKLARLEARLWIGADAVRFHAAQEALENVEVREDGTLGISPS